MKWSSAGIRLRTSSSPAARAALHTVAERVPERFLDVELGESHGMSLAASLARQGLRPVVVLAASRTLATIAPLLTDARQAASPLTILAYADAADDSSAHGPPLRAVPGLEVVTPAAPDQLRDALAAALAGRGWTLIQLPARATPE